LRIVVWNANSVSTKKAELDLFLKVNKIDIATISETKLLPKYRFTIPGYTIYRSDRNQFGGGVMLIINNNLGHDQFYLPNLVGLEATAICLYLQNHNQLLFVSTYLPPPSAIVPADLEAIFTQNDSVLLVGDLNSKHVTWNNTSVNRNGGILLSYCINNIFINYPDQPTHFPHNSNPSVLDIALSKRCPISKPLAVPALSSDHNSIVFKIHLHPAISKPRIMYDYKQAN
jgi:hypothetical protein